MDLEIRPVEEGEVDAWLTAIGNAFGEAISEEHRQLERETLELDRTLAVFDGADIVGSAAAYSMELTVPGGTMPLAGVTGVAVVPTHRRRGVLTELMRRQLADIRDRGEALAGLWASEGSIYQRFGYGMSTLHARFDIDRTRTAFARPLPPDPGRLRMVQRDEALRAMPAAYERVRPAVPGMLGRSPAWWKALFSDLEEHRHGASPLFFVLHEAGGRVDGYLTYRVKSGWDEGVPSGEAVVHELVAEDPPAYAALWRFILNHDLVAKVSGWKRPADEPLLYMLAEPRRLELGLHDAFWLRLVDVGAALTNRSYAADGAVVLQVADGLCPWNDGRFRLEAGTGQTTFGRTEDEPDLLLDVSDLGAVYLGGTTFDLLHRAGRVQASSGAALRRADDLFRTPRAPWCPHIF